MTRAPLALLFAAVLAGIAGSAACGQKTDVADAGQSCIAACDEVGQTRCFNEQIQTCVDGEKGCLDWAPARACPTGYACSEGQCLATRRTLIGHGCALSNAEPCTNESLNCVQEDPLATSGLCSRPCVSESVCPAGSVCSQKLQRCVIDCHLRATDCPAETVCNGLTCEPDCRKEPGFCGKSRRCDAEGHCQLCGGVSCASLDGGTDDASVTDPPDAGLDAGVDAAVATVDAGADAGADAGIDAGPIPPDAGPIPPDAGPIPPDAGLDAGTDASTDGDDGGSDAGDDDGGIVDAGTACFSSADCVDPFSPFCDPQRFRCVMCLAMTDCTNPQAPYCRSGSCSECQSNIDCTTSTRPYCSTSLNRCVECRNDLDCVDPTLPMCVDGACSAFVPP